MVNGKKGLISVFIIMMMMFFCVKYSYSQDKPSMEVMKSIIAQQAIFLYEATENIKYTSFQITHSFFKKGNDGRDIYFVEVNYEISYNFNPAKNNTQGNKFQKGEVEKYSFMKKGDKWYGGKGWGIN